MRFEVICFFSFFHETYAHFVTREKLIIDLYRKDNAVVEIALYPAPELCVDSVYVQQ